MADAAGFNPEIYRHNGGFMGKAFCSVAHPDNPDPATAEPDDEFVFCRRLPHHDGSDHAAFIHSIKVPETWPDVRDL